MIPPAMQESSVPQTDAETLAELRSEASPVHLSVIVPVTRTASPLESVYHEYAAAIRGLGRPFEFLFAVEPWAGSLVEPLRPLIEAGEPIRIVESARTVGEANLLRLAGEHSSGRVTLTLPAYLRVQADALPDLLARIEEGCDLVVARRWPRQDGFINRLQSRAFNGVLRALLGQTTRDVACGVQVMRREVLDETPVYGDFLRFLPVLAAGEGFKVAEVDAPQHPGDLRTRVYSPGTYFRRLIDILGLFFLIRFTDRPLRFFGLVGSSLAGLGSIVLLILLVQRQFGGQPLANRPMLLVGVVALTLGVQAIALGLIGEIIVHFHAARERHYRVLDPAEDL